MNKNISNFFDPEKMRTNFSLHNLGVVLIAIVAVSVSWSSTKVIQRNYRLMKQISVLEQEVKLGEVTLANQKLMNEYYKTDTYLEIAARKQFNKALPGEKLMLIPKSLALEKVPKLEQKQSNTNTNKLNISNWQKWMRFLSGKAIGD